ncbi:MAG: TetR/AcrR family transcriptional regulator [Bacteroidota bacterium]
MDKRTLYIKESLKLFMKYGIRSVTVGQITNKLNISSKTLYNLFGDKAQLVQECFQLYRDTSDREFEVLRQESVNVADMVIRFYNQLVTTLSRTSPNFFNDLTNYFPEFWNAAEAFGIEHTKIAIQQGIEEGLFVPHIDVLIASETLTLLVRAMFERDVYVERGGPYLLSNVLWPYVRGICTARGLVEFRKYRKMAIG